MQLSHDRCTLFSLRMCFWQQTFACVDLPRAESLDLAVGTEVSHPYRSWRTWRVARRATQPFVVCGFTGRSSKAEKISFGVENVDVLFSGGE